MSRSTLLALAAAAASFWSAGLAAQPAQCIEAPEAAAEAVVAALFAGDAERLAALVHPDRGVRVSPSAYVDRETDLVLPPEEVAHLWTDPEVRAWGYAEGSGEPVSLSGGAFVEAYLTVAPFDEVAPEVQEPSPALRGATVDNAAQVYPEATIVELYWPGRPDEAQDWSALRLAFHAEHGCQRLVGLISDRWAP